MRKLTVTITLLISATPALSQQRADTTFHPVGENPAYSIGEGQLVLLDPAHRNFHTLDGRFMAFGRVSQADGFLVRSSDEPFSSASVAAADILVISNALNERNVEDWSLPPLPHLRQAKLRRYASGWSTVAVSG